MKRPQLTAVVFDWAGTVVDFGSRAPMGAFVATFAPSSQAETPLPGTFWRITECVCRRASDDDSTAAALFGNRISRLVPAEPSACKIGVPPADSSTLAELSTTGGGYTLVRQFGRVQTK